MHAPIVLNRRPRDDELQQSCRCGAQYSEALRRANAFPQHLPPLELAEFLFKCVSKVGTKILKKASSIIMERISLMFIPSLKESEPQLASSKSCKQA